MHNRIHIVGASGSGTSTLGRELAKRFACAFFDADDFYWKPTNPPYQLAHDREVRRTLLANALAGVDRWVLAGSICGWGDSVANWFDLAIFVVTPTDVRLKRLRDREEARFGKRIEPGGDMHEQHNAFLDWAARYDEGSIEMRSRRLHEQWLKQLNCPILRVDGARTLNALCGEIATYL